MFKIIFLINILLLLVVIVLGFENYLVLVDHV